MELRQVVTGTLAWTGLVVVVAVPTAEALLSRLAETPSAAHVQPAEPVAATADPIIAPKSNATPSSTEPAVKQASVTRPAGASAPIIGGDADHAAKPVTAAEAVEVAPAPLSGGDMAEVAAPDGAAKVSPQANVAPDGGAGATPSPIGVPSDKTAQAKDSAADLRPIGKSAVVPGPAGEPRNGEALTSEAAGGGLTDGLVAPPPPVPMSAAERPKAPPLRVVTAEELKGWKSGSLADYLRQQNIADSGNSAPNNQN
jgi:hypothetical protein